jgi:hypothetical protein
MISTGRLLDDDVPDLVEGGAVPVEEVRRRYGTANPYFHISNLRSP